MNTAIFQFFTAISTSAGSALAASIWQGIVLAVCVSLCLRLLPGISAAARSLVWMGVFAAVLLLHFAPFVAQFTAAARLAPAGQLHVDPRWALLLAAAWITLSSIRATQLVISANHLRRVKQRATPIACDLIQQTENRRYTVCTSSDVDRPSVVGFFSPRILLPPGLAETLSPQELQQVLLHETEHLRRHDDWTNLLQKLALVLFPLNPVLFWVERRLCLERELACDDRVLGETGARKLYATCLTHLAEHSVLRRRASLALGAWERKSELARRVHRILRQPEAMMGQGALKLATTTVLAGLFAAGLALSRSPQLVSFGPAAPLQSAPLEKAQSESLFLLPHAARTGMERRSLPASATLVKAILPVSASHLTAPEVRPAHPAAKRAILSQTRADRQPHLMTTGWNERESQGRLVLTVSDGSRVSYTVVPAVTWVPAYAAVPVPNGWIIFQL